MILTLAPLAVFALILLAIMALSYPGGDDW